jgi:error-prone DNA polymerase
MTDPLEAARASGLVRPGEPLLVLVSGGADSICLLDVAVQLGADASALHVDHGLRPDSGEDAELCRRACEARGVPLVVERLERLAEAGALRGLVPERRRAVWNALAVGSSARTGDLFAATAPAEPDAPLPEASVAEEVAADYATTGLSERAHPMSVLRPQLASRRIRSARELARLSHDTLVHVAGLVIVRQRPGTAKGIVFLSLEDETGIANLVLMPDVYDRYRPIVRGSSFIEAQGTVERSGEVVNVRVRTVSPLSLAHAMPARTRDFH